MQSPWEYRKTQCVSFVSCFDPKLLVLFCRLPPSLFSNYWAWPLSSAVRGCCSASGWDLGHWFREWCQQKLLYSAVDFFYEFPSGSVWAGTWRKAFLVSAGRCELCVRKDFTRRALCNVVCPWKRVRWMHELYDLCMWLCPGKHSDFRNTATCNILLPVDNTIQTHLLSPKPPIERCLRAVVPIVEIRTPVGHET